MRHVMVALILLALAGPALAQPGPTRRGGASGGLRGPCRTDADRLCKGVEPGQGRLLSCLRGQEAKLTPACKEQLARAGQPRPARPMRPAPPAAEKK